MSSESDLDGAGVGSEMEELPRSVQDDVDADHGIDMQSGERSVEVDPLVALLVLEAIVLAAGIVIGAGIALAVVGL